ncbi:MAG: hypothetical protein E7655_09365 [Ruminococcaceae bacterium]|nr:hypothetical protein [Oscillospiraceae bacterium]
MKHNHKLQNIILTVITALLFAALLSFTASAEELTPITGVSVTGISMPVVGQRIHTMDGSDLIEHPSGKNRYNVLDNQTSTWVDEEGRLIKYALQTFEAGRTYSISFSVEPMEGYAFTSDQIPVELYNLYSYQYTGSITLSPETENARITFTFSLGGERTYADIGEFSFYGLKEPVDGDKMWKPVSDFSAYNNSELTDCYWADSKGTRLEYGTTFEGGNSYSLNLEFTAFDGYHFADYLSIKNDSVKMDYPYSFNADMTKVCIKIPYSLSSASVIDQIVLEKMFLPEQGLDTRVRDCHLYVNPPEQVCYTLPKQTLNWVESKAEYHTQVENAVTEKGFIAGKQYKTFLLVYAEEGYKFADPESMSFRFSFDAPAGFSYSFESGGAADIIILALTFTAQFPEGYGYDIDTPVWCHTYIELKYALEHSDLRYVALGNVDDTLPMIPHDEALDPGGITRTAIVVRGHKDLNLQGNAVFRCPLTGNYDLKYYIQLITLTDAANSSLYIHGKGSLTYEGGGLYFVNSVIKVEGGHLTVDGTTIRGSIGYHTGFCYGINAIFGSVSIQSGATVIGEVYGGDGGISALVLGSEGVTRSLSVSIFDGNFHVERDKGDSNEDHGISVQNDCGLKIHSMTSDGIELRRYAADTLADYISNDSVMTVDGIKTAPASCSTTSGIVEVYREISEVDIHVNTPKDDASPAIYPEQIYSVPDGCSVVRITWLEDGEALDTFYGSARFTAGKHYQAEIALTADEGVRFQKPLSSATVNGKTVSVSAQSIGAEYGIILTADFGICPDLISEIELTIDPPKQNGKPDVSAFCGHSSYKQAPAGVNAFNAPLQWQESNDGSSWTVMNLNDTFTVGYSYRVFIDVMPLNGYEFALDSQLDPNVTATLNGYSASVSRYPEDDPGKLISVCYDFGILNDSIIEQIDIDGITEPVVGESPLYTCAIAGNGYTVNKAYDNGTYAINGICWYDVTFDMWVRPKDTFQIGHEYKVFVDVKTENGYEFYTTPLGSSYKPAGWGYINGNYATLGIQSDGRFEQSLSWTFTCQPKPVSLVEVSGIDIPVAGSHPDFTAKVGDPDFYRLDPEYGIIWYDGDMNEMTPDDTFEAGMTYRLMFSVIPVEEDGQRLCKFVNDKTAVTINGNSVVKKNGYWDEVSDSPKRVTVYYTFSKSAMYEDPLTVLDAMSLAVAINNGAVDESPLVWLKYDFNDNGTLETFDIIAIIKKIVG